ncbi:tetratricopeptide repeat protein [Jiulongibacter sediminis]|uniref:Uncharacterized protein n=1 Tax=Jiulongibacter sediminis TaxID=1605367 RepID=A0A0P7BIS2_9BACT|nr:tetratricopeptide repeat protein [Jiulongibacter sediminis]KPM47035.1 hypothetical protein AFM12_17565 [Jiulongibacter sediminis]TBX22377.1 hypothetical protein TK44_17570 [Jiulongibacter sediminis]
MKTYQLLFTLFAVFFCINSFAQGNGKTDSLEKAFATAKHDTIRSRVLNGLFNAYLYNDAEKAKMYALKGIDLGKKAGNKKIETSFNYLLGVYYSFTPKSDSAEYFYKKTLQDYRAMGDSLSAGVGQAISSLAIITQERGDFEESERLFKKSLDMDIARKDTVNMSISYSQLGRHYITRGYLRLALNYTLEAIQLFKTTKDQIRLADAYNLLSGVEMELGNFQKSIEYNELAIPIYKEANDQLFLSQALNDAGLAASLAKNYSLAEKYLNEALTISRSMDNFSITSSALQNLGKVQFEKGQTSTAIRTLKESLSFAEKAEETFKIHETGEQLAKVFVQSGQVQQALSLTNKALEFGLQKDVKSLIVNAHEIKSLAFAKLGQYAEALEQFKLFHAASDSLDHKKNSQEVEELRIIYESEKKEAEIEKLALEIEKSNLQKTLFAGGMISAILIAGLLYFGFRQRSKRNKAEYEKEKALIAKELEFKKKELVSQTLHLVNKNTLIQNLQQDLKEIRKTAGEQTKEIGKIIKDLQQENASDANWEVFKSHFAQVHNDFDIKLKQKAPDITDNEIRLAAFLKMKLSTKEIAGMLNVQPDSITKSKYRLKKKFNLEVDDDFDAFLEGI